MGDDLYPATISGPGSQIPNEPYDSKSAEAQALDPKLSLLFGVLTLTRTARADLFQAHRSTDDDWAMIQILFENRASGRHTVAKNIAEATGTSNATVRAQIDKFLELGYIRTVQSVGRSVLYDPTPKLEKAIMRWADSADRAVRAATKP